MMEDAFIGICVFACACVVHELGHFFYMRWILKKEAELRFGWFKKVKGYSCVLGFPSNYQDITPIQYYGLVGIGVVAGLIPIFMMGFFQLFYLLLIIPYLRYSFTDLKNLCEVYNEL